MKKLWNWKWRSVPMGIVSAVLIVVLIAGSAFAAFTVRTYEMNVTVAEAIETTVLWDISGAELYPGGPLSEGGWMQFGIENVGPAPLDITVELKVKKGGSPVNIDSVLESWAMLAEGAAVEAGQDFTIYTAVTGPVIVRNENNPGSLAFEIGTVDYELGDSILIDSNAVWFWISGKVRGDIEAPLTDLQFVIKISRG